MEIIIELEASGPSRITVRTSESAAPRPGPEGVETLGVTGATGYVEPVPGYVPAAVVGPDGTLHVRLGGQP